LLEELAHLTPAEQTRHLAQQSPTYRPYVAWDLPTRLFHWINALAVIGLLATGIAILNDDALGFSAEGKVLLKSVHVSFGYVMALNLVWRFVWAFFGNRYARWRAILPGGPGFIAVSLQICGGCGRGGG
jgi:Ni/Fe-hydrogenase 1 B-type cytochrome subunit